MSEPAEVWGVLGRITGQWHPNSAAADTPAVYGVPGARYVWELPPKRDGIPPDLLRLGDLAQASTKHGHMVRDFFALLERAGL